MLSRVDIYIIYHQQKSNENKNNQLPGGNYYYYFSEVLGKSPLKLSLKNISTIKLYCTIIAIIVTI